MCLAVALVRVNFEFYSSGGLGGGGELKTKENYHELLKATNESTLLEFI